MTRFSACFCCLLTISSYLTLPALMDPTPAWGSAVEIARWQEVIQLRRLTRRNGLSCHTAFAAATAVMYHGNSALRRQRITEWHQQGSSQGGKPERNFLSSWEKKYIYTFLLKLKQNISFCVGLPFECTSAVWNNKLNAFYSRPCLFTGTNQWWFYFRTRVRWKSAPAGWSSELRQLGALPNPDTSSGIFPRQNVKTINSVS